MLDSRPYTLGWTTIERRLDALALAAALVAGAISAVALHHIVGVALASRGAPICGGQHCWACPVALPAIGLALALSVVRTRVQRD